MSKNQRTSPLFFTGDEGVDDIADLDELDDDDVDPGMHAVDPRGSGFKRVSRRVCLIRRNEAPEGTGFMVGADLMLTAAHNLLGTSGIFVDPAEVTILFDQFIWNKRKRTRAAGDQCRLRSIPFTHQPDIVGSSIKTDPKCRKVNCDNGLDYALVRLDRPMGLSFLPYSHRIRGWTDCSIANIPAQGDVFVVQHPLGGLQQFAPGNIPAKFASAGNGDAELEIQPDPPKHFRYYTKTLNGSSGSLICNPERRVVGLHVGERLELDASGKQKLDKDGRPVFHQLGVSLQDILADLQADGVVLPSNDLDRNVMDTIFGSSRIERERKRGEHWGGDRLFHKP
ncbi:MAG TPA: serine protease [Thermoanaerobaculia bacterium]|nr:serine protease [Thermoanaerobaculia bacterium]